MTRGWMLLALMMAASCGWYGTEPISKATPLRRGVCPERHRPVELYFENERPKEAYTGVGLIEVVGGSTSTDDDLLERVRWQAHKLGANAVVAVRKQFKSRVQALKNPLSRASFRYSATVFTGLAVCIGG